MVSNRSTPLYKDTHKHIHTAVHLSLVLVSYDKEGKMELNKIDVFDEDSSKNNFVVDTAFLKLFK